MKLAETEGTGISYMAETEGTGIINYAETEGTGIKTNAETEGTGINKFSKMKSLFFFMVFSILSFSTIASELDLHSDNEGTISNFTTTTSVLDLHSESDGTIKGIWKFGKSIEFVEGYYQKGKLSLYVVNSLFDKATDNGTGDKATDNGTGNKATDNGTGKATENGTGESILTLWTTCKNENNVLQSTIESGDKINQINIETIKLNGMALGCHNN